MRGHGGRAGGSGRAGRPPFATASPTGWWPRCPTLVETGAPARRKVAGQLPRHASTGIEREALLVLLDGAGVCAVGRLGLHQRGEWSRRTCWRPWASRPTGRVGALRLSLGTDDHRRRRRPGPRRDPRRRAARLGEGRGVKVLVAMSGGVDSSVAAALLVDEGHDVIGVTLRLWGGAVRHRLLLGGRRRRRPAGGPAARASTTSCSTSPTSSTRTWSSPYVADHAAGRTPNPCIECNRHLKFGRLLRRATALGFDAVATGHHARVVRGGAAAAAAAAGRRPGEGPVLRALRARPGRAGPQCCSRSAT